VKKIKRM